MSNQRSSPSVGKNDLKVFSAKLTGPHPLPPKENRQDPSLPLPPVHLKELDKGILSCMTRGFIPGTVDVTSAMTFGSALPLLSTSSAPRMFPQEKSFKKVIEVGPTYGQALKLDTDNGIPPWPFGHPLGEGAEHQPTKPWMTPQPSRRRFGEKKASPRTPEKKDLYHDFSSLNSGEGGTEVSIVRGRVMTASHAFVRFQCANKDNWGPIVSILRALERLCDKYSIPTAILDASKVIELAMADVEEPRVEELMSCFANGKEVRLLVNTVGRRFCGGHKGRVAAATAIQATWRGHRQMVQFSRLSILVKACRKIQQAWKQYRALLHTRRTVQQARELRLQEWRKTMEQFAIDWPKIQKTPRLIIHIPSLSYTAAQTQTVPFYQGFQTAQMAGRLCDLEDPNVSLVYITPQPVERAVAQYYIKILVAGGVKGVEDRITFLYPEVMSHLPSHVSLAKGVLWSAKLLKQLQELSQEQVTYIVPCVPGPEDLQLASQLQLPLLGPDPEVCQASCTKSGHKQILEAAQVPTPLGICDLFDYETVLDTLADLAITHPTTARWLLKLNNGFAGRGIAYLDVHRLKALQGVVWDTVDMTELKEHIQQELQEYGSKRFKMVQGSLYNNSWTNYVRALCTYGVLLEAAPTACIASPAVNFFIHPTGLVEVTSVQEQILSPQYCCQGAYYPVTSMDVGPLTDAAIAIGQVAHDHRIMGHCTVDFVVFQDEGGTDFWAVDLNLRLTDHASIHHLTHMICKDVPMPSQPISVQIPVNRCYFYSGLIYHSRIRSIDHVSFFKTCKTKGISFHVETCTGVVFHLVGSLEQGCIGVLCMGVDSPDALAHFSNVVLFLQDYVGGRSGQDNGNANFHQVAAACRTLNGGRLLGSDTRAKVSSRESF